VQNFERLLKPVLVAEVSADHITGEHMRHGAHLLSSGCGRPTPMIACGHPAN